MPQLRDALGLAGSPDLSDAFVFLPAGFLAGLPLSCNTVDPTLPAEALRGRPTLEPLVASCREAAARYSFSPFFGLRLAAARDQEAARRALASCAEVPSYLADFPSGRYRAAVEAAKRGCEAPPPATLPAPVTPPAPIPTPLQLQAAQAVAVYFHRHDYGQGDSFAGLARLYGPEVEVRGAAVPAADHMRRLGAWYGGYDSIRFTSGARQPRPYRLRAGGGLPRARPLPHECTSGRRQRLSQSAMPISACRLDLAMGSGCWPNAASPSRRPRRPATDRTGARRPPFLVHHH